MAENIEQICEICQTLGVQIIEDISQAQGASFNGKKLGTFGDASFFSTMGRKSVISGSSAELYLQTKRLPENFFNCGQRKYVLKILKCQVTRHNIDISPIFRQMNFALSASHPLIVLNLQN